MVTRTMYKFTIKLGRGYYTQWYDSLEEARKDRAASENPTARIVACTAYFNEYGEFVPRG